MTNANNGHPPKVWMNVTTSVNWKRAAVGIVRVEQELCKALSGLFPDGEFGLCTFQDGEFVPYSHGSITALPERVEQKPLLWPDPSRRFPRSSTFDSALGRARPLPRPRKTAELQVTQTASPSGPHSQRQIRYGDIILSVGLDWDHSYTNQFQRLRDEQGIKIVSCCYDLIPVIFPQYCVGSVASQFKDYFTKLSWSSSLILCISEKSRADYREMVQAIGAPEVETIVIPLGDNVPDAPPTEANGKGDEDALSSEVMRATEAPFILFVGTIERRKNHEVLYRAYHLLARSGHAGRLPKLVFVGMPGWGVGDLLKDIEFDPLTRDLIIQLNHATDRELRWLYEKAYFCAYPSLYEGWGLPVGEALACGKAIIASSAGSIPEVGGDLVTYLDPWNPQAWADEILALVDDPERVRSMEAAVRERYRARSWHDTAVVVKSALDRLLIAREVCETLYPGYHLQTESGVPCGESIRSIGPSSGAFTHGPYRSLPPGAYEIGILIDKLEGGRGEILIALRTKQGEREHGSFRVSFDEQEHFGVFASTTVQLDDYVEDYEIFSEISGNIMISLNRVDIQRINRHLKSNSPE